MSVKGVQAVFQHSRSTGSARVVLLAIAECLNGSTGRCDPSIARLAKMGNVSRRQCLRIVELLRESGELETFGRERSRLNYKVTLPGATGDTHDTSLEKPSGDTHDTNLVTPRAPTGDTHVTLTGRTGKTEGKARKKRATSSRKFDPTKADVPAKLDTPEFRKTWADWCGDRKARGKPITERAATRQLNSLAKLKPSDAVACIDASISNGWTGIFPERFSTNGTGQPAAATDEPTAWRDVLETLLRERYQHLPQKRRDELRAKHWHGLPQTIQTEIKEKLNHA